MCSRISCNRKKFYSFNFCIRMSSCQTGEVVMEQVSFLSFLCLRQYWGEI